MKKIYSLLLTRVFSVLALMLFAVGGAWADEVTYTPSEIYNDGDTPTTWASTPVKITFDAGGNSNKAKYYDNGKALRLYSNNTMTVSVDEGYYLVSITVNVNNLKNGGLWAPGVTDDADAIQANGEYTWTADDNNTTSATYTVSSTKSSQARIASVTVVYAEEGGSNLTPAGLAFTPATVTCNVDDMIEVAFTKTTDAEVTFTSSNEAVAVYEDGVVYAFSAGTATITASCAATNTYAAGTATLKVTVNAPMQTVDNIAAFKALKAEAALKLNNAVVIGRANNGNTYIQDATGGICLYKNVPECVVGSVLNGTVVGTYAEFNGLPELSNGDYTAVTITAGEAPVAKEINIDDITPADYCTLVTIKNAHCDGLAANAVISQAGNNNTIKIYTTFMQAFDFPTYTDFDVTGVLGVYNADAQILPRSAADFTEIEAPKVTVISVDAAKTVYINNTVELDATVNSGAVLTYVSADENIATVSANGVVTGIAAGETTITITAPAFEGYPEATATVSITVIEQPAVVPTVDVTDVITVDDLSAAGVRKSYSDFNDIKKIVGVYAGNAMISDKNEIQMNKDASKKRGTLVSTTSGGTVKAVSVTWATGGSGNREGRYLTVYGKNTPYESGADLYDTNKRGTELGEIYYNADEATTSFNITDEYKYVGLLASAAIYMDEIAITWAFPGEVVTIGSTGFATLYYGEKNLVVPEGVCGWTYGYNGSALIPEDNYTEGTVIPAGEAVVLYTETPATYAFLATNETNEKRADNALKGTDEAQIVTADNGNKLYKLSDGSQGIGFYQASEDGVSFENGAHKAYLEVPATAASAKFFSLDGGVTTAIDAIQNAESNTAIYTISGQKVQSTSKPGLYIMNGKKFIVK